MDHLSERGAPARVLITGIEGFTGPFLKARLERDGHEVHGLALDSAAGPQMHRADLLDTQSLQRVIAEVKPGHVIHLAGISSPAHGDAAQFYQVNVGGTRNLLAALASHAPGLEHVLLASSANIYGNQDADPLYEEVSPAPTNDYAVSKAAMEMMAGLWRARLPITILRPFNYTGRGQSENFLMPKIVGAYRRREARLELGNTHVERDYSDVRDVVDCYARLLTARPDVVNICSGRAASINDVLAICGRITGHAPVVSVNPQFVRGNEVHRLRGDRSRLDRLGVPGFRALEETMAWMLEKGGAD